MTTSDDNKTLTSTQALNAYFASLLDEDYMDDDPSDALSVQTAPNVVINESELSQAEILENELNADPLFANENDAFEVESAWALDPEVQQKRRHQYPLQHLY